MNENYDDEEYRNFRPDKNRSKVRRNRHSPNGSRKNLKDKSRRNFSDRGYRKNDYYD